MSSWWIQKRLFSECDQFSPSIRHIFNSRIRWHSQLLGQGFKAASKTLLKRQWYYSMYCIQSQWCYLCLCYQLWLVQGNVVSYEMMNCCLHDALGIQIRITHEYQQSVPPCCTRRGCQTTQWQKAINSIYSLSWPPFTHHKPTILHASEYDICNY